MRFVGGYWPSPNGNLPFGIQNGNIVANPHDPLRLDSGQGTFFGVEESIFRSLVSVARTGNHQIGQIPTLESIAPFYSAISLLRDGSVVGPVELFFPVDVISV